MGAVIRNSKRKRRILEIFPYEECAKGSNDNKLNLTSIFDEHFQEDVESFINNSNNLGVVSYVSENFFNWFDDKERKDSLEASNEGQNVAGTYSDHGSCSSTLSSEELESEDDNALARLAKSLRNETEAAGEVFDVLGVAEESSQESLTESSTEDSQSDEEGTEARLLLSLKGLEAKSGSKELCTGKTSKLSPVKKVSRHM